jgi:hypothetical protein
MRRQTAVGKNTIDQSESFSSGGKISCNKKSRNFLLPSEIKKQKEAFLNCHVPITTQSS